MRYIAYAFFIALISTWTTQQMCYTWSKGQQLLEMDLSNVLEYTHNVNHSRSFFRGFVYTYKTHTCEFSEAIDILIFFKCLYQNERGTLVMYLVVDLSASIFTLLILSESYEFIPYEN